MAQKRRRVSPVAGTFVPLTSCCWGAQLQGTDASECTPGHVVGTRHFKTKFCTKCRASVVVPKERVRGLSASMASRLKNNHSGGMWSDAFKQGYGPFRFRVINNTHGCTWPLLVVFEDPPPDELEWMDVPPELQADDGSVCVGVSRGTLVPVQHIRRPPPREDDDASDVEASPAPVLCEVLVPSPFEEFAKATKELVVPEPEPESESPSCDSDEAVFTSKEARRMHRNRQSAAKSRLAKREYIASLERNVLELEVTVDALRKENWYLQSMQTFNPDGNTIRMDWSVLDAIEC